MNRSSFVYGAVLALVVFCLGAISAQSQNVYCVRQGATGSGNGSDWNNAYTTLPATLQRGATYYIADGSYPAYTFDDAESGTSWITIKKATVASHGTSAGWLDTYGDGQAVFNSTVRFETSYILFDGQTRNESDWFDGPSYGFKVDDSQYLSIMVGKQGSFCVDHITLQYTFIQCVTNLPSTTVACYAVCTDNFDVGAGQYPGTDIVIRKMYAHGGNNTWMIRQTSGTIVEYCASKDQKNNDANHAETFNLYLNVDHPILRYNWVKNFCIPPGTRGTAVFALTDYMAGYQGNSGYCEIYGNIVEDFSGGNAVIGFGRDTTSNNKIYNNTFIRGINGNSGIVLGYGSNNIVRNNVWIDCAGTLDFTGDGNPVDHDYSVFSGSNAYGEAHAQTGLTSAMFVNYSGGDYRLAAKTAAGATLPSPYNTDMLGKTRGADGTWDRGAYEYGGVADTTPPVITNLSSSSVTSIGAMVAWTTDEAANGVVEYGTTTAYGFSVTNVSLVLTHSITLGSLVPVTVYHYRVRSTDTAGNTRMSGDFTFTTATPPSLTSIAVTPAGSNVVTGVPLQFIATGTYSDGSKQNLTAQATWTSSNTGVATINASGLATGASAGNTTISAMLSGVSGSTTLTVQSTPLAITTSSLPNRAVGTAYTATLTASGGKLPYSWSLASGALPPGLTLNGVSGAITGTPTTTGAYNFTVRVSDSSSPVQSVTRALSISITVTSTVMLIGNRNEGTITDPITSWINAVRFQATNDLTVNTISAKVAAIAGKYQCAIYSDSNGQPNSLLRGTSEVSYPISGWRFFPLTSSLVLTTGQYYWLAIWSDDANAQVYYSDTAGTLRWGDYTYGAWPNPVATTGGTSLNYCIYATSMTVPPPPVFGLIGPG